MGESAEKVTSVDSTKGQTVAEMGSMSRFFGSHSLLVLLFTLQIYFFHLIFTF